MTKTIESIVKLNKNTYVIPSRTMDYNGSTWEVKGQTYIIINLPEFIARIERSNKICGLTDRKVSELMVKRKTLYELLTETDFSRNGAFARLVTDINETQKVLDVIAAVWGTIHRKSDLPYPDKQLDDEENQWYD